MFPVCYRYWSGALLQVLFAGLCVIKDIRVMLCSLVDDRALSQFPLTPGLMRWECPSVPFNTHI